MLQIVCQMHALQANLQPGLLAVSARQPFIAAHNIARLSHLDAWRCRRGPFGSPCRRSLSSAAWACSRLNAAWAAGHPPWSLRPLRSSSQPVAATLVRAQQEASRQVMRCNTEKVFLIPNGMGTLACNSMLSNLVWLYRTTFNFRWHMHALCTCHCMQPLHLPSADSVVSCDWDVYHRTPKPCYCMLWPRAACQGHSPLLSQAMVTAKLEVHLQRR